MVLMGFVQFGMANAAFKHEFDERFPSQSADGIRAEWLRLESRCYDLCVSDIGNPELFDIHRALQRQIKACKQKLTNSGSMNIHEVEACHKMIESGYVQCKEAATVPEDRSKGGEVGRERLMKGSLQ